VRLLTDVERDCLDRYVQLLVERLGDELVEISIFGSVARDEAWPAGMPIRSDLDLYVETRAPLTEERKQELFDETYPLFLESGRQISPAFVATGAASDSLAAALARDGVHIWP